MDQIGDTICINPGQSDRILHAVIIDIVDRKIQKIISYPGGRERFDSSLKVGNGTRTKPYGCKLDK